MVPNLTLYVVLRIAHVLIRFIPLRTVYASADLAALIAYYLFPAPRHNIESNLSVVTGRPTSSPIVHALARQAFRNDARNWVDTLRISYTKPGSIDLQIEQIEGWEHLERAVAAGSGVVLVSMHLGNYDFVGQLLAARGFAVTIPVEVMKPARLFDFLSEQRRSQGIQIVPLDHAPRRIIRALRAGEIVAIMGDRAAGGKEAAVNMLGRPALLPTAAVALARRTGAPILVGFGVRDGNRYRGVISPVLDMQRTDSPNEDEKRNLSRVATAMGGYIREYPGQWLMFRQVWTREAVAEADTMKTVERVS